MRNIAFFFAGGSWVVKAAPALVTAESGYFATLRLSVHLF